MSDIEQPVLTYKGRALEALSRDELLEAARWAYREVQLQREWALQERKMEEMFRLARLRAANTLLPWRLVGG